MTSGYAVAVVTFRRPAGLRSVLDGLAAQTRPPNVVVVVDNDRNRSGETIVAAVRCVSELTIEYVAAGDNLGPAGGWALAATHAARLAERGSWLAVIDDDDPITSPRALENLLEAAEAADAEVASVGLRGAVLHRRIATLHRTWEPTEPGGSVDYLASGGVPLYRWSAIDSVGFFDPSLFFGFEDLELGLRLRIAGHRLVVVPFGEHQVSDTASDRSEWREYFKTRALVVICRRHVGYAAMFATIARTGILGAMWLLVTERRWSLVVARWRGITDGLRDRLGPAGFAPETNPAKG